jgi:hypothetical protein
VALIAAVLAALWLATARLAGWALALAAVLFLWPAVNLHFWDSRPDLPKLFSTPAYHRVFKPRDTVLVLPVGIDGQSMLWAAEAHLGFAMASGYVVPPEASDPYKNLPIDPTLTYNAVVPHVDRAAAEFLSSHHVTVTVLSAASALNSPWPAILASLGWGSVAEHGAVVLRPGELVPEPSEPLRPRPRLCSLLTEQALAPRCRPGAVRTGSRGADAKCPCARSARVGSSMESLSRTGPRRPSGPRSRRERPSGLASESLAHPGAECW